MKRYGFKMKLKPGYAGEYKKRHQHIWPELKKLLTDAGIQEYSIWLDEETHILFAEQKLSDDFDGSKLPEQPVMKKWWEYMKDLMETHEDMSPVCKELKEVFYLKQ